MRKLFACLALLVSALVTTPLAAAAAAQPPQTPGERAAAIVSPSIVFLRQDWVAYVRIPGMGTNYYFENGWVDFNSDAAYDAITWSTRCTGFIVNPGGHIVTAGHCVDDTFEGAKGTAVDIVVGQLVELGIIDANDAASWAQRGRGLWRVEGTNQGSPPDRVVTVFRAVGAGGITIGNGGLPARVMDFLPVSKGDVALLKIEDSDLPSLAIARSEEVSIGTELLSVGYPGSADEVTDAQFEPSYESGQINAKKTREGGLLPVYQIDSALSGGMSGGPTVTLSGEVIGVNSFGIAGEEQQFNFISPASLIREVLSKNGVSNQLGQNDKTYREGLSAYFAGDAPTAIERFDAVLAQVPTHAKAQEYKTKANKWLAEHPPAKLPILIVIPAAMVVLLGGGAAMLAVARRKKRAGGPEVPETLQGQALPIPSLLLEAPGSADASPNGGQRAPATTVGLQAASASYEARGPQQDGATAAQAVALQDAGGYCGNCGAPHDGSKRFCEKCGQPLVRQ